MIQVTEFGAVGTKYIDPMKVTSVCDDTSIDFSDESEMWMINGRASIQFDNGDNLIVTQSPAEVARLITEYKQRQMRLQAAYAKLYDSSGDIRYDVKHLESEDRGE